MASYNWQNTFRFLESATTSSETADMVLAVADNLRVKKTITYIVCGLLFRKENEKVEILMMQEAREDCHGAWYLPAGRLEPNETLDEGMRREVLEETGIECQAEGLVSVETLGNSSWFRFTFLAHETGGCLKVVADKESLSAAWYLVEDVLERQIRLRSSDILKLVKIGVDSFKCQTKKLAVSVDRPISKLLCRVCAVRTVDSETTYILVKNVNAALKLPIIELSQKYWFGACIHSLNDLFTTKISMKILSCICVESCPKPAYEHDGVCITVLCEISSNEDFTFTSTASAAGFRFEKCNDVNILENFNLWSKCGCKFI